MAGFLEGQLKILPLKQKLGNPAQSCPGRHFLMKNPCALRRLAVFDNPDEERAGEAQQRA